MATAPKVSIAIVGTGHIGPRHARSVLSCTGAALSCFVDPDPRATTVAIAFEVPLFRSIQEMLDKTTKPDAAIVCTPNRLHSSLAIELLEAGTHVLVEKPITNTIASGQQLLSSATSTGMKLLVAHHRRFSPFITAAKTALVDGVIGRPIAVSGLWATCKPSEYFDAPADWRARSGDGGPILINLIHEIDCLQYLLGPIVRVHAEHTICQRDHDVEEGAAILLRFDSGVVGTFLLSDATPSSHFFEAATGENPIIPQSSRDIYRIFGTEGTLSIGDMIVSKQVEPEKKAWTNTLHDLKLPIDNVVPFDEQVRHLVAVIRGEEQPRCTGEDGLSALIVCAAIKRAMVTGTPIDVELQNNGAQ